MRKTEGSNLIPTNRSINRPTARKKHSKIKQRSTNRSINRTQVKNWATINDSINEWNTNQTIIQAENQSINQSTDPRLESMTNQSISHSIDQSAKQTTDPLPSIREKKKSSIHSLLTRHQKTLHMIAMPHFPRRPDILNRRVTPPATFPCFSIARKTSHPHSWYVWFWSTDTSRINSPQTRTQ